LPALVAALRLGTDLCRELWAALSGVLYVERKVLLHDVLIRPARLKDAEALQRHCYAEANLDDVRDYLAWCLRQAKKGRILRLVAEVDGQAVGNAQLTVWGQVGEIGSLVVAEAHRQHGVARKLLAALIAEARRRGLVALELSASEEQPAILAFYQRMGFRRIQDRESRLSHPALPETTVQLRMSFRDPQGERVLGGEAQSGCDG
jgi:ribosomal protein S18 acetylase RimI-like enzyme